MKLTQNSVKILTEGQQLEKAILEKYPTMSRAEAISEFANLAERSPSSVDRYARSTIIESKSFKLRAAKLLDYDFKDIFLSEEEQITKLIESISANISDYTDIEDNKILIYIKDICFEKGYKRLLAQIYWCIAMYHKNASKANIAVEYVKLTISLFEEFVDVDKLRILELKSELGLLYLLDGDYKSAIDVFEGLLVSEDKLKLFDSKGIFLIYYRLGICLLDLGEYNQSRKQFERAFANADNNVDRGHSLKNIGIIYKIQKQYKKALEIYDEALKWFDDDIKNISIVLNNKAMLYREQGDLRRALDNINLVFSLSKDEKENSLKYNYLHTYTLIQIDMGEPIEALNTLLEMTEVSAEFVMYKKNIYLGIQTLLDYAFNNSEIKIVNRIQNTLILLIKKMKDIQLKAFLGDILIYKKEREVSI